MREMLVFFLVVQVHLYLYEADIATVLSWRGWENERIIMDYNLRLFWPKQQLFFPFDIILISQLNVLKCEFYSEIKLYCFHLK